MSFRIIATTLLVLLGTASAAAQTITAPTTWINQRGSILKIDTIDPKGKITGWYTNKDPKTECRDTAYPIGGRTDGKAILFVTAFPPCFTVTEWQGALSGPTMLSTKFEAAYPQGNGHLAIWKGADVFTRQ